MESTEIFYTVTDRDTAYTNSRSARFPSFKAAINEIWQRQFFNPNHKGCFVMKSVGFAGPVCGCGHDSVVKMFEDQQPGVSFREQELIRENEELKRKLAEKNKAPWVRRFVQTEERNPALLYVEFIGDKGFWVNKNGTRESMDYYPYTVGMYVNDSGFKELTVLQPKEFISSNEELRSKLVAAEECIKRISAKNEQISGSNSALRDFVSVLEKQDRDVRRTLTGYFKCGGVSDSTLSLAQQAVMESATCSKERDVLAGWKREALQVLGHINVCRIGGLLNLQIGTNVYSAIEPGIKNLLSRLETVCAERDKWMRESSEQTAKYTKLYQAAESLYRGDHWQPTRLELVTAILLWENLRVALGMPHGTSPNPSLIKPAGKPEVFLTRDGNDDFWINVVLAGRKSESINVGTLIQHKPAESIVRQVFEAAVAK